MHGQLIQEMQATERLLAEQIRLSERTLERLVTLEDFFHGMSPDEAEGFMRRKGRK
jgi:hypothetical protein